MHIAEYTKIEILIVIFDTLIRLHFPSAWTKILGYVSRDAVIILVNVQHILYRNVMLFFIIVFNARELHAQKRCCVRF